MGKALKTVGMVVGAAALVATGAGALLMPGMGQVTLFGLTTGQLNMLSTGLMAVGGMLDKPQSAGSGSADEWTSNPDQPIPFAFGRVGVAGKIVHRDEYGPDNRLQGIVSVYSGAGPIKAFISYKADGAAVTFEANGGTAIGKFNRQMWRSWRLGAQPDTALTLPTGLDGGAVMPGWGASHRLSGKACDLLTVQQDSKFSVYPTGLPTPQVELDGIYGYDPRYDDTYPGGAGTCRLGIRSTYRWIDNPIIAGLNWALGLVENGQVVGGIGASINGIDVPAFVEAANIADVNNWKVTAWPDTSEDVSEVLKQFLQAGGASYARHAGKISCVSRGAARPSIVTITGRDTAGAIELDTGASLFNKLNTITPEFMSAAHGWKHVPANPVTFEALRLEDGGKRSDSIRYRFVPSALQAGQLAAYDILDAREPFAGTVPLKPHLRQLKRGDCFVIDEPGFLLDGVKCLVLSRTYDPTKGEVRIAFRSETDGKHDLALGKTATVPSYPALTAPDPTYVTPPQPGDWVVIPRLPNEDAVEIPIIDIVGEVGNATATGMRVEWGFEPDPPAPDPLPEGAVWADYVDWHSAGVWPVTATRIPLEGAPPGSQVYVALSYQRGQNWSAREVQGPVTVPGLVAGGLVPGAVDQIIGELNGRVEDAVRDAVEHLDGVISGRDEAEAVAEVVLETILNEQNSLEREASQRIEDLAAEALARGEAFALAIETSQQQVDDYGSMAAMTYATISGMNGGLAATLNEAKSYTNGQVATAMNTVYTKAQTDSGLASTLQSAKSYTDTYKSEAQLLFSTKTERANGDAAAVIEAKSYTDDYKSEASLTFATQVALSSGLASTLTTARSYTDGEVATAMNTVYTKAQTDSGLATTLQEAKSHTDAYKTEASLLFSTKAERSNGDASTLQSAKSYTDDYKSEASLTFATQAALSSGLASTLTTARSYTDGEVATAMNTVYTKAQTDSGLATTLQEAKSHTDAYKTEASLLFSTKAERSNGDASTLQSAKSYTDDYKSEASQTFATQSSLGGVSSTASLALSTAQDAATKLNEARVSLRAAASGSRPALLQLLSGTLGSSIALSGDEIWFGDNTVFDDASQTFRSVSGSVRTVTLGPFGANGDLALWVGPNSVAKGSESKANAYVFVATTAPRFGGSDVPIQTFHAQADHAVRIGTRTSAGLVTTSLVTITASGATGTVSYDWTQIGGDETWTITAPSGPSTAFRVNVDSPGQQRRATFACLVKDSGSGRSFTITVGAAAIYNV